MYSLFFVFFFLCLCFCFLSCLFFNKYKFFLNSRLIIGGKGFAPILIIGGRLPGLPPRVYACACQGRLDRTAWTLSLNYVPLQLRGSQFSNLALLQLQPLVKLQDPLTSSIVSNFPFD